MWGHRENGDRAECEERRRERARERSERAQQREAVHFCRCSRRIRCTAVDAVFVYLQVEVRACLLWLSGRLHLLGQDDKCM